MMLTEADQAIKFIRANRALTPDRPFFIYFAPGGAHGPHHVHKEWADKYKGDMAGIEVLCTRINVKFSRIFDALCVPSLRSPKTQRRFRSSSSPTPILPIH